MIPREVYIGVLILAALWMAILVRFRIRWWTCLLSFVMFLVVAFTFLTYPSSG